MKNLLLTKSDLLSLLDDRIIYHRDGGDEEETRYWTEIREALENDMLDITGYDRGEWKRFNIDDPKTFPPEDANYLVQFSYGETEVATWWNSFERFTIADHKHITHWRPLTPPLK